MISLCMIVKDEEKLLNDTLKSIKDYIKDIIIVDTGSKDRTKEIALRYTNKVYDFQWCNDFSKARNYSIEKADNEIILVLDADEKVIKFDCNKIIELIQGNPMSIGRIECVNLFNRDNEFFKCKERVNRVFSRTHYKYEGSIHEQLVPKSDIKINLYEIPITVEHTGYDDEVINNTNKIFRNISMLKEMINNHKNDPYLYYQLGKSYYMQSDYIRACDNFQKALSKNVDTKYEYVEDLIETYGYSLINSSKYLEAMKILNLYEVYKENSDFVFLSGLIFMNNGYINEAIKEFKKAVTMKDCKMEGVNSYLANYNLGVIYECVGNTTKAIECYKLSGNYKRSMERLRSLKIK